MKRTIVTSLKGIFIQKEAWENAHESWFKQAADELNDKSVLEWIGREDYFKGVDKVMERLAPDKSEQERVEQARQRYFDAVCDYLEHHSNGVIHEAIPLFKRLRERFSIVLLTTSTEFAVNKILQISDLTGFFDMVFTCEPGEKDDKLALLQRFCQQYGKPIAYVGSERKDVMRFLAQHNIRFAEHIDDLEEMLNEL